ncbi:ABC transporter ATP-binding protein/permease [Patescibacteria group bacterium]|jgi:ATP-binding cassette subfamily B protein|nr:ABC transporter ATP-binding protein/permease [Patescibacteria group bacterium]
MQQEKTVPVSAWSFVLEVWRFTRPYSRFVFKALAWATVMQVLALVEPYLLMRILDDVVHHGREAAARVPWLALGAFVLLVITSYTKVLKDRQTRGLAVAMRSELPVTVLGKLLKLPLAYHQRTNASESTSTVQDGVENLTEMAWIAVYDVWPVAAQALVVIIALLTFHWSIPLLICVTLAAYWASVLHTKGYWRASRRKRVALKRQSHKVFGEGVANVMTVQAYSRETHQQERVADLRREWGKATLHEHSAYDRSNFRRNSAINFVRVGTMVLCAYLYFADILSIGEWVFAQMLTERLFNSNFQLAGIYDKVVDSVEPVRTMIRVMSEPDVQADPEEPQAIPSGAPVLKLSDVTYAYPSRPDTPVLSDVNLTIRPGNMIGIVGESGQGKSTLAKLLLRFYDPTVGVISLSGIDIRQVLKADLRKLIGYVPQEVELFDATIAENIRYGAPQASDEDVRRAAELARALPFIERTERGFDTLIGDRGLRLSGGERQRVGIARAVLTGAQILIFDEATSSVDPETIYEIKRAMNSLRQDRTLVVISHQLSTIQDADVIVVLKDGRISGTGTHVELMRSNETYMGFVRRQQNADSALLVAPDPRTVS